MQKKKSRKSGFVLRKSPPSIFLLVGILSIISAAAMTSRIFPNLGPPPERLYSQIDSIRRVAEVTEVEILLVRILFVVVGITAIGIWVTWSKLRTSRAAEYITNYHPTRPPPTQLFNSSLVTLSGGAMLVVVWVAIGGFYPILMNEFMVGEDGVVESTSAILILIASGFSLYLSFSLQERRRRIWHLILGLGFLFIFFEEISWGQRILKFDTPDYVMKVNAQREFNVHNSFGFAADHIYIVGVLFYGAVVPILANRSKLFHRLFDMAGLPIASLGLAVGFALASALHDWTLYSVLPKTHLRIAETRELLCALGFLLLMIEARSLGRSTRVSNKKYPGV